MFASARLRVFGFSLVALSSSAGGCTSQPEPAAAAADATGGGASGATPTGASGVSAMAGGSGGDRAPGGAGNGTGGASGAAAGAAPGGGAALAGGGSGASGASGGTAGGASGAAAGTPSGGSSDASGAAGLEAGGATTAGAGAGGAATAGMSGMAGMGGMGGAGAGAAGGGGGTMASGGAGGGAGAGGDPAGKVVLFDGTSFDEWRPLSGNGDVPWELPGDGTMVVVPDSGNIVTRQTFEDLFVHVEYKTPMLPDNVTGQDRGNSGVYLNSMYELQVLDSFGLPPMIDGCGAVYGVNPPSSTACYEQEVWNTYEIEFQAARFDAQGQKQENARVLSAYLNDVLVQEDVEVPDSTQSGEPEAPGPGPLMLQDHKNQVAFRNIWVIPR